MATATAVRDALTGAGKTAELKIYPPFEDNGHDMFQELGDYWTDIEAFLASHL